MGLFIGEDGQPSLSLFQILLWTIITVWALLFVFFNTGNLLMMTQQVMVLLGFAGVGSLAARWVAASRQPVPMAVAATTTAAGRKDPPAFWAMLENEKGFDLFKLQLFLFTVLIAAYVAFRVLRQSAFPVLDTEFLLLMGVSNGLYVGSKVAEASPFAQAETLKLQWDVLRLRVEDLEAETKDRKARGEELKARADAATDPAEKQGLVDQKTLKDQELKKWEADLAQARIDRDAKDKQYKDALAALTKA